MGWFNPGQCCYGFDKQSAQPPYGAAHGQGHLSGIQRVKEETTYGLSPKQLAKLLAIGLQDGDGKSNSGMSRGPGEMLQEILAAEPPLDPSAPDSFPAILNRPCDELLPTVGRTTSDLLLDSKTDLSVMKTLKDYYKALARPGGPEAKQAAVTVIYYAAIASALVFHAHKITKHPYQTLREAYAELEQKPWVPPELKDLFRRAKAACHQRKGRT